MDAPQSSLYQAQRLLGLRPAQDASISFSNSVIVSIDLEFYEEDQDKVTEIGISTLQVDKALGMVPGPYASGWHKLIESHHFRILENAHLRNSKFVDGRPEDFRFGATEFILQKDITKTVERFCTWPTDSGAAHRPVTLIGHDIAMDLTPLALHGFDIANQSHVSPDWPTIDTQTICRAVYGGSNKTSLANMLQSADIYGFGLHNAGNDARYTMQAFLSLVYGSAKQ